MDCKNLFSITETTVVQNKICSHVIQQPDVTFITGTLNQFNNGKLNPKLPFLSDNA
jgi:hypothetical protein